MSLKCAVEWLFDPYLLRAGASWNRWWGCTKVSKACVNCYISRTPPLRMRGMKFDKAGVGGKTPIVMADQRVLYYPLGWRAPMLIFPESLSDLWHPAVPIERKAEMWAVMLLADWHIFITTTKRHQAQRNWLRSPRFHRLVTEAVERIVKTSPVSIPKPAIQAAFEHLDATGRDEAMKPLSNVWVGVTCEANENGDRLRYLGDTPAAVTWDSAEPVCDPGLDLHNALTSACDACWGEGVMELVPDAGADFCDADGCDGGYVYHRPPDWFVFGGESGPPAKATELDTEPAPGLRDMDLDLLEYLMGQATELRKPIFIKQFGEPWAKKVGAASKAGRDPAEWPAQFQVREYPIQLAERALRFDPDNRLARKALDEAGIRSIVGVNR